MSDWTPFTAEDLSMQYDADTWFPFVENEDCNITGYGHQDKDKFAAEVNRYDQHIGNLHPDDTEEQWTADDVAHAYAVRLSEERAHVEVDGESVGPETPGAFPVTTLWGQR